MAPKTRSQRVGTGAARTAAPARRSTTLRPQAKPTKRKAAKKPSRAPGRTKAKSKQQQAGKRTRAAAASADPQRRAQAGGSRAATSQARSSKTNNAAAAKAQQRRSEPKNERKQQQKQQQQQQQPKRRGRPKQQQQQPSRQQPAPLQQQPAIKRRGRPKKQQQPSRQQQQPDPQQQPKRRGRPKKQQPQQQPAQQQQPAPQPRQQPLALAAAAPAPPAAPMQPPPPPPPPPSPLRGPTICEAHASRYLVDGRRCDGAPSDAATHSSMALIMGYPRCTDHLTPACVEAAADERLNFPSRLETSRFTYVFVDLDIAVDPLEARRRRRLRLHRMDAELLRGAAVVQIAAVVAAEGAVARDAADVLDPERFPACEWRRREGGPPLSAALSSLSSWISDHHRRLHGPSAAPSDIVLIWHYAPYAAPLLGNATERAAAPLPGVWRCADSCLLANYAQTELPAAWEAAGGQPQWLARDGSLDTLVARFGPAWLTAAGWYRRTNALSDARAALVATQALSRAAWGDADAWRAFALGGSCSLAAALGRAGYAAAARMAAERSAREAFEAAAAIEAAAPGVERGRSRGSGGSQQRRGRHREEQQQQPEEQQQRPTTRRRG